MSNTKSKKLKRNKSQAKKRLQNLNHIDSSRYPQFKFLEYNKDVVNPEFVSDVKNKAKGIDLTDQSKHSKKDRDFFKLVKIEGFLQAASTLEHFKKTGTHNKELFYYSFYFGNLIYQELGKEGKLTNYLPFNDCFINIKQDIVVLFRALENCKTPGGRAYYSKKMPTMSIGGNKYIIAFSRHAIERIAQRCANDYLAYGGSGDVFAYLSECLYYEPCVVTEKGSEVPAFTFYEKCEEGFFSYNYVRELIKTPEDNLNYYYRIGYCPVAIYNEYAIAKTLITPGMNGTPENQLALTIKDYPERMKLQQSVQNAISKKIHGETNDFYAIKHFHESGIPQVISKKEDLYNYQYS